MAKKGAEQERAKRMGVIECPACGEDMRYWKSQHYWQCLVCDAEFWPPIEGKGHKNKIDRQQIKEAYMEDKQRGDRKGGGQSSGRKRPDSKLQKSKVNPYTKYWIPDK